MFKMPRLPMDFYFPTKGAHVHSCRVSVYIEEVSKCFKDAYTEAHLQTNSEADQQKWYYDKVTSTVQLMPGDVVLMKLDTSRGREKSRTGGVKLSMWSYIRSQMTYPHMR